LEGETTVSFERQPLSFHPTRVSVKKPQKGEAMIISVPVDINLLLDLLRKFPWPRPDCCPECNNPKLWGHGFADSLFDFAKKTIPLKRYICPNCGCVIKLRPQGYFKRFQASIDTIRNCIDSISVTGKTIKDIARQRQRHWFVALQRKVAAVFGLNVDLKQAFEKLIASGIIPVSRAI
jgi:hypothetical protein